MKSFSLELPSKSPEEVLEVPKYFRSVSYPWPDSVSVLTKRPGYSTSLLRLLKDVPAQLSLLQLALGFVPSLQVVLAPLVVLLEAVVELLPEEVLWMVASRLLPKMLQSQTADVHLTIGSARWRRVD